MLGELTRRVGVLEREKTKPGGIAGGPGLDDTIVTLAPDAWWKFNENSGNTAADSSANGHDATVAAANSVISGGGSLVAPTWAQAALAPGTQAALFGASPDAAVAETTIGTITGDFTAGVWLKISTISGQTNLMGAGPFGGASNHAGWSMHTASGDGRVTLWIGNTTSGPNQVLSDNPLTTGVPHLVMFTRTSGVWRMYIDGLLQSGTYTEGSYTPAANIWFVGGQAGDGVMSYGMVWGSRGLSGAEVLELATTATTQGIPGSGTVPVAGGDGTVTYETVDESLLTLSDVTTLNVSMAKHGFAPKLPNDATKFLDGTGAYTVPAGGSGSAGDDVSTAVAIELFG